MKGTIEESMYGFDLFEKGDKMTSYKRAKWADVFGVLAGLGLALVLFVLFMVGRG